MGCGARASRELHARDQGNKVVGVYGFGGGKLKITGAMSKTQVVGQIREYIADNLESVIVDAIMTEKFEEGMGSYAF